MSWLRVTDGGVALDVLVQPRASRARLGPLHGDRVKLAVTAPPDLSSGRHCFSAR